MNYSMFALSVVNPGLLPLAFYGTPSTGTLTRAVPAIVDKEILDNLRRNNELLEKLSVSRETTVE